MSEQNFWYANWPRIGIICAIFILLMLFLNSNAPIASFEWFYWFSLPLYMIHQFEEYVYPGGFKEDLNKILLGENASGEEVLTEKRAFFINIIFIWTLTPILIVLGKIAIFGDLAIAFPTVLMTLVAFNGFIHLGATIRFKRYNPGVIVSVFGNIPLGLYVLIGLGVTGTANPFFLFGGIIIGIIAHMVLFVVLGARARKIKNS